MSSGKDTQLAEADAVVVAQVAGALHAAAPNARTLQKARTELPSTALAASDS